MTVNFLDAIKDVTALLKVSKLIVVAPGLKLRKKAYADSQFWNWHYRKFFSSIRIISYSSKDWKVVSQSFFVKYVFL